MRLNSIICVVLLVSSSSSYALFPEWLLWVFDLHTKTPDELYNIQKTQAKNLIDEARYRYKKDEQDLEKELFILIELCKQNPGPGLQERLSDVVNRINKHKNELVPLLVTQSNAIRKTNEVLKAENKEKPQQTKQPLKTQLHT
jgi:hypothetical protein